MNALFLCGKNRLRSPTAEAVFSQVPGLVVDSAGVSDDATVRVSSEQLEWADVIFVMESSHKEKLARRFGSLLRGKKIVCLGIPDEFSYMEPRLVELLSQRVARHLPVSPVSD